MRNQNKVKIIPLILSFVMLIGFISTPVMQIQARNFSGGNTGGSGGGTSAPPSSGSGGSSTSNSSGGGGSGGGVSGGGLGSWEYDTPNVDDYEGDYDGEDYEGSGYGDTGCCCCDIIIPEPYETNFRTMQVLDVMAINNEHTDSASDYRPNIEKYVNELPEVKMADIIEYQGLEKEGRITPRENVPAMDGKNKSHTTKLEDLIDKNIINRDTEYILSEKGSIITPRNGNHDVNGVSKLDGYRTKETDRSHQGRIVQRYERPSDPMSRTDFVVELMKTEKILESPPILVRSRYSRVDNTGMHQFVDIEEVERSPYQDEMGKVGLDTGQTDVMISHELFGKIDMVLTNDIPELYIRRAYNKGFFLDKELVNEGEYGKLLNKYLLSGQPSVYNDKAPRYSLQHKPMRLFYLDDYPTGKQWEMDNVEDGQYPSALADWEEVIEEDRLDQLSFDKTSPIWGEAYDYYYFPTDGSSTNAKWLDVVPGGQSMQWHVLNNWTNNTGMRIVRKRNKLEDPINGYGFFKQENISVMDAIIYTYKHLKEHEGEKSFTQEELDYINATYSLDMTKMTGEERKAVEFLIAKGIISGDDMDLSRIIRKPLTNSIGIDLLWRVVNKEERYKITPTLTELDKEMLQKGYKKAKVNVNHTNKAVPQAFIDKDTMVEADNVPLKSFYEVLEEHDQSRLNEYDLILIQSPKSDLMLGESSIRLVTNDSYRSEIEGYIVGDKNTGQVLEEGNSYWKSYIIHKDYSHNLMLIGNNHESSFSFSGINGSGIYTIPEDKKTGVMNKWELDDFSTNKAVRSYFSKDELRIIDQKIASMKERSFTSSKNESKGLLKLAMDLFKPTKETDILEKTLIAQNIISKRPSEGRNIIKTVAKRETSTPVYKTLWKAPILLNQNKSYGQIKLQPITEDDLKNMLYKGEPIVVQEGNNFRINKDNPNLDGWDRDSIDNGKFKVESYKMAKTDLYGKKKEEETVYAISYPSKSKQHELELANFMSDIEHKDGITESVRLSGYARMSNGDNNKVIISKAELKDIGINTVSDKILENPRTGQRAFINTHDKYTIIGNNVTQYNPKDFMVNAFGSLSDTPDIKDKIDINVEGTRNSQHESSKIFYNLEMVMELINDKNVILNNLGSNNDLFIGDYEYTRVPIIDAEGDTTGNNKSIIDYTYLVENDQNQDFVNLSAVTGNISNFIYYENKTEDMPLELILVYRPKVKGNTELNVVDEATNNSLTSQIDGPDAKILKPVDKIGKKDEELEKLKSKIIKSLFKGVNNGEDFLNGDYRYDIYLMNKGDKTSQQIITDNFLAVISSSDKENEKIKELLGTEEENEDLNVKIINAGDTLNTGKDDFAIDPNSGNLYYRIGKRNDLNINNEQNKKYRDMFDQNLYLNYLAEDKSELLFRRRRYYDNTPKDFIPLEVYAENDGSHGSLVYSGGREVYNFKTPKTNGEYEDKFKYKIPGVKNSKMDKERNGGNFHLTSNSGKNAIKTYTHLELPWVELKVGDTMEGLDIKDKDKWLFGSKEDNRTGEVIDIDLSVKGSRGTELARDIFKITAKLFQDEINKGFLNEDQQYNIMEVFKNTEGVLDYTDNRIPANLMSGTWHGVLSSSRNYSNYHLFSEIRKNDFLGKSNEIVRPDGDTINQIRSGVGDNKKLQEPFIVLVSGTTPEINNRLSGLNSTKKNRFYNKNHSSHIYAIEIDNLSQLSNAQISKDRIKEVTSMAELNKIANKDGKRLKVIMKPSIGIPQGTTLVDSKGRLVRDNHNKPRNEILYANNILNSLIFRTSLDNRDDVMLISDIPKNSFVRFSESTNNTAVTLSDPQGSTNSGNLKWVHLTTTPVKSINKDRLSVTNASEISKFYRDWGDVELSYNGVEDTNIKLKGIMGKASGKLTDIAKLESMAAIKDSSIANKYYSNGLYWADSGKVIDEGEVKSYEPKAYSFPFSKHSEKRNENASPVYDLILPPTIVVQKAKSVEGDETDHEGVFIDHDYIAIGYMDISGFNVDPDDSYMKYLRDRDTPAVNILKDLEVIYNLNMDSSLLRNLASTGYGRNTMMKIITFLHDIIPIICYTLIVLLNVMWVLLKLPITRGLLMEISYRLGGDLAEELAVGKYSIDNLPLARDIMLTSFFIAFIGILFDSKVLWKLYLESVLYFRNL